MNNGGGHIIVTNRTIMHVRGNKICRPIREPIRSLIKQQFAHGATVYRVHQERLQKRTREEREAYNYDVTGKTRNILRKIKSEHTNESLLSMDVHQSIAKLNEKFQKEVNPDGKIKGAIQQISKYPCQIIVYTESSIRLFDTLLKHNSVVVSWDATGSVIQEKKNSPRLLYYELSITLPGIVSEDSIVPVTFMVFVGKTFPRPQIVLSDRAQIFLIGSLQIWNNESMKDFLNRAYRIVNGNADDNDLKMMNIHACLSHVLLDIRKTINKYIEEQFRELAMWSIALLINTSTWYEFKHNWKLICLVFLQLSRGEGHGNRENQDALLDKIKKIKSDTNTVEAVKISESAEADKSKKGFDFDPYAFNEEEEDNTVELDKNFSRVTKQKIILDEEQEANATDSAFKTDINQIFRDALVITGISLEDALAAGHGDLTRHRRRIVQSYERILIMSPQQRTTAISERRMCILKRTQLGGHIHIRLDILLSILVPDMITMIDELSNALFNYCTMSVNNSSNNDSIILDERRLRPIQERWRQSSSKRNHGHYTKGPDEPVFTDLVSSLFEARSNVNADLKLPLVSPEWLNIAIGLILSTGNNSHNRCRISSPSSSSLNSSSLLDVISKFIEEWSSTTINHSRTATITLSLPINESNEIFESCTFMLENILIPLLPCKLIVDKVHICEYCQFTIKMRMTVTSIPIRALRTGLHIEHQLSGFFGPIPSDLLCSVCNKQTTRHLEVVQWPPILIINVIDSEKNVRFQKPPGVFSLSKFSSWHAIGGASSTVYDLICFNSIIRSGITEKMVRITKIKKSWSTSINKRLIGHGEQLRRLFAHSRILIFERINNQNKVNIIHAINQCSFAEPPPLLDIIPYCITLQEACTIIETYHALNELNDVLIANIKTYFYCHSCHSTPDSLFSLTKQIFIFKLSSNNKVTAYPIVPGVDSEQGAQGCCTSCRSSTKNIEMHTIVDRNILPKDAFDSNLKLIDVNNVEYAYTPRAIFLISRYSDTISIIKQQSNKFIQYIGTTYSEPIPISYSKMIDLFDTSGTILVFYHQDQTQTAKPNMRIVSYSDAQGVPQLIIQDGNRFFSIKPVQSYTSNNKK
ncbi:unnamed protein product [Rotaria sordida]|uniref:Uncharacterized protein n=1 Tax=Rotaria sordida TaxID=392033 RepID=A0A819DHQ2_9BILA|nr:unnamed protein product [Rotaria sordida]